MQACPGAVTSYPALEPMTVCACTGRTFTEVASRMRQGGLSMAAAERFTGCGSICCACLPEACRTKGDNGSRLLLESILAEEETHIDWLEAQLRQIEDIGIANYLAQQTED